MCRIGCGDMALWRLHARQIGLHSRTFQRLKGACPSGRRTNAVAEAVMDVIPRYERLT